MVKYGNNQWEYHDEPMPYVSSATIPVFSIRLPGPPGPREVQRAVCSVAGFKIRGLSGPADVEKCDTPWMPWMPWMV